MQIPDRSDGCGHRVARGGRGIGEAKNFKLIEDLAKALGGAGAFQVVQVTEQAIIEAMLLQNKSAFDAVVEAENADGSFAGDEQARQRATIIESAIEL